MSDRHITIVVRGPDGSGRTQIGEKIKRMLINEGFTQVDYLDNGTIDLFEGGDPKAVLPIHITESR